MNVEIKICGLGSAEDRRAAEEAGADYLGVVFTTSPRQRSEGEARAIWVDAVAKRVGVFADAAEQTVLDVAGRLDLNVVQLHGAEEPICCRRVSEAGEWAVWKAVRLREERELETALERYSPVVDGLVVEGWSPRGHGGVGARFDWSWLEGARESWPEGLRLVLAGGLNPDNVAEAIGRIRPAVVDVSSGVEAAPGVKDPDAIAAFVEAVRSASR
ncbi:MAG: phosphoribosylanthranilate isomerase [Gemmatimonadales bacterium]|jgi:phosphoribosylanthranilate isomerase